MVHPRVARRFRDKVVYGGTTCHRWSGATDPYGYGVLRDHGRILKAHRLAWAIAQGIAYDDVPQYIGHTCGCRTCVNPEHLFEGKTQYVKGGVR